MNSHQVALVHLEVPAFPGILDLLFLLGNLALHLYHRIPVLQENLNMDCWDMSADLHKIESVLHIEIVMEKTSVFRWQRPREAYRKFLNDLQLTSHLLNVSCARHTGNFTMMPGATKDPTARHNKNTCCHANSLELIWNLVLMFYKKLTWRWHCISTTE